MKNIKTPPGAKRLITSLRDLGYECKTAVADLIDNSIAAGASEIYVDVFPREGRMPAAIVIADNGIGMDRNEIIEAMRFGSFQDYSSDDLGKFGLGLKTASLSQCRQLTVASKPKKKSGTKSRRNILRWDLDHVFSKDDWNLQQLEAPDLDQWELDLIDEASYEPHGTVVIWRGLSEALPLLDERDEKKSQRFLAKLLGEISAHLRMVFHRYMQNQVKGRPKLSIIVGEEQLEPWDPFCVSERGTKALAVKSIKFDSQDSSQRGKHQIIVSPYILPNEGLFSSREAWKDASGPKNWNQQQGFYIYRNGRLLQAGGWSYMRSPDEHTKYLRVAIDFPSNLDKDFSINVTKMRALIPPQIRDELRPEVTGWAKSARSRYDTGLTHSASGGSGSKSRATPKSKTSSIQSHSLRLAGVELAPSNVPGASITTGRSDKDNKGVRLVVPYDHVLAEIFDLKSGKFNDVKRLTSLLMILIEAVAIGKLKASEIPLKSLRQAFRKLV